MRDTSKFQREKIGTWKPASDISSLGITLPLSLSPLVKSMYALSFLFLCLFVSFFKFFFK